EKNQLVAVVEAMKMETQITSAIDGKIDAVFSKEGDRIEAGELLLRLE
ncbi:MAG: biotin/lipoyl-binding protein, partial [Tissierellia bacterium]|nr:biotin/lipoyl-binding protein [Tissierellia bacterium]